LGLVVLAVDPMGSRMKVSVEPMVLILYLMQSLQPEVVAAVRTR
jgi:hypothetical protein